MIYWVIHGTGNIFWEIVGALGVIASIWMSATVAYYAIKLWMSGREDGKIMKREKTCGTCRHHKPDNNGNCDHKGRSLDWVCVNRNSDYYTDYTLYGDSCDEWEGKDNE